jgi:hypothetical protein
MHAHHEQMTPDWGRSQMRANPGDMGLWVNWLYAWEKPASRQGYHRPALRASIGHRILAGWPMAMSHRSRCAGAAPQGVVTLPEGEAFAPIWTRMDCWLKSNLTWER